MREQDVIQQNINTKVLTAILCEFFLQQKKEWKPEVYFEYAFGEKSKLSLSEWQGLLKKYKSNQLSGEQETFNRYVQTFEKRLFTKYKDAEQGNIETKIRCVTDMLEIQIKLSDENGKEVRYGKNNLLGEIVLSQKEIELISESRRSSVDESGAETSQISKSDVGNASLSSSLDNLSSTGFSPQNTSITKIVSVSKESLSPDAAQKIAKVCKDKTITNAEKAKKILSIILLENSPKLTFDLESCKSAIAEKTEKYTKVKATLNIGTETGMLNFGLDFENNLMELSCSYRYEEERPVETKEIKKVNVSKMTDVELREHLMTNPRDILQLPENKKSNPIFQMIALESDGSLLTELPGAINDPIRIHIAVLHSPSVLQHVSSKVLRREIYLEALYRNSDVIGFIPKTILLEQDTRKLILEAIKQTPEIFNKNSFPQGYRSDVEVISIALQYALNYMHEQDSENKKKYNEIVKEILKNINWKGLSPVFLEYLQRGIAPKEGTNYTLPEDDESDMNLGKLIKMLAGLENVEHIVTSLPNAISKNPVFACVAAHLQEGKVKNRKDSISNLGENTDSEAEISSQGKSHLPSPKKHTDYLNSLGNIISITEDLVNEKINEEIDGFEQVPSQTELKKYIYFEQNKFGPYQGDKNSIIKSFLKEIKDTQNKNYQESIVKGKVTYRIFSENFGPYKFNLGKKNKKPLDMLFKEISRQLILFSHAEGNVYQADFNSQSYNMKFSSDEIKKPNFKIVLESKFIPEIYSAEQGKYIANYFEYLEKKPSADNLKEFISYIKKIKSPNEDLQKEAWKNFKSFAKVILQKNGLLLEWMPSDIQEDPVCVEIAIKHNPQAILYTSSDFQKKNKELLLQAIDKYDFSLAEDVNHFVNILKTLEMIEGKYWIPLVAKDLELIYKHPELQKNKEIMLYAIQQDAKYLDDVPNDSEFWKDPDFFNRLVMRNIAILPRLLRKTEIDNSAQTKGKNRFLANIVNKMDFSSSVNQHIKDHLERNWLAQEDLTRELKKKKTVETQDNLSTLQKNEIEILGETKDDIIRQVGIELDVKAKETLAQHRGNQEKYEKEIAEMQKRRDAAIQKVKDFLPESKKIGEATTLLINFPLEKAKKERDEIVKDLNIKEKELQSLKNAPEKMALDRQIDNAIQKKIANKIVAYCEKEKSKLIVEDITFQNQARAEISLIKRLNELYKGSPVEYRLLALDLVKKDGLWLKYIKHQDAFIVLCALLQNPISFQSVSPELRTIEIEKIAVEANADCIKFCRVLIGDSVWILEQVKKNNFFVLKYISSNLWGNKEFMKSLASLGNKEKAILSFVPAKTPLLGDAEIILRACKNNMENLSLCRYQYKEETTTTGWIRKTTHTEPAIILSGKEILDLKENKGKSNDILLQYIPKNLKNSTDFFEAAVINFGPNITKYFPDIKMELELLKKLFGTSRLVDILKEATYTKTKAGMYSMHFFGRQLILSKENLKSVFLTALDNPAFTKEHLKYIPHDLYSDKEIATKMINISGEILKELKVFQNDTDIVTCAINENANNIQFAHSEIKKNSDMALSVLQKSVDSWEFIDPSLWSDLGFVMKAMKINKGLVAKSSKDIQSFLFFQPNLEALEAAINKSELSETVKENLKQSCGQVKKIIKMLQDGKLTLRLAIDKIQESIYVMPAMVEENELKNYNNSIIYLENDVEPLRIIKGGVSKIVPVDLSNKEPELFAELIKEIKKKPEFEYAIPINEMLYEQPSLKTQKSLQTQLFELIDKSLKPALVKTPTTPYEEIEQGIKKINESFKEAQKLEDEWLKEQKRKLEESITAASFDKKETEIKDHLNKKLDKVSSRKAMEALSELFYLYVEDNMQRKFISSLEKNGLLTRKEKENFMVEFCQMESKNDLTLLSKNVDKKISTYDLELPEQLSLLLSFNSNQDEFEGLALRFYKKCKAEAESPKTMLDILTKKSGLSELQGSLDILRAKEDSDLTSAIELIQKAVVAKEKAAVYLKSIEDMKKFLSEGNVSEKNLQENLVQLFNCLDSGVAFNVFTLRNTFQRISESVERDAKLEPTEIFRKNFSNELLGVCQEILFPASLKTKGIEERIKMQCVKFAANIFQKRIDKISKRLSREKENVGKEIPLDTILKNAIEIQPEIDDALNDITHSIAKNKLTAFEDTLKEKAKENKSSFAKVKEHITKKTEAISSSLTKIDKCCKMMERNEVSSKEITDMANAKLDIKKLLGECESFRAIVVDKKNKGKFSLFETGFENLATEVGLLNDKWNLRQADIKKFEETRTKSEKLNTEVSDIFTWMLFPQIKQYKTEHSDKKKYILEMECYVNAGAKIIGYINLNPEDKQSKEMFAAETDNIFKTQGVKCSKLKEYFDKMKLMQKIDFYVCVPEVMLALRADLLNIGNTESQAEQIGKGSSPINTQQTKRNSSNLIDLNREKVNDFSRSMLALPLNKFLTDYIDFDSLLKEVNKIVSQFPDIQARWEAAEKTFSIRCYKEMVLMLTVAKQSAEREIRLGISKDASFPSEIIKFQDIVEKNIQILEETSTRQELQEEEKRLKTPRTTPKTTPQKK